MTTTFAGLLCEQLFQTLFEKSPGSILISADSPKFTIIAASDTYLKVTSVKREEITGKGFFEVFPDDKNDQTDPNIARNVFARVIATAEKIDVPTYRYDVLLDDGTREPRYWSCSNTPIIEDGRVVYILNTIVDITGEVKAKQEAIEKESRLRMAAEATGFGTWELNIADQSFSASPRIYEIFGHPATANNPLNQLRDQVHPDDMQNVVIKAYYKALETGNYAYEVRIFWPDDSMHWIKTQGKVLYDDAGQPERMLGTMMDITESKRDEIRKNDFIAMASHELKTPLTSLKAYIQLLQLKTDHNTDPFVASTLAKADNQVNKMTALIHGFLNISKLEPGKLQITPQPFNLNQLVNDVVGETMLNNTSHNIETHTTTTITINADKEKIGQVLNNLLSNAIKYSPRGSTVNVDIQQTDNHVQVAVRDYGMGIQPKDQEKLFQRFYRVDSDNMKNISGFGIGLYLSNEIIQRHRGKIWVDSSSGEGSTFYFTLPLTD